MSFQNKLFFAIILALGVLAGCAKDWKDIAKELPPDDPEEQTEDNNEPEEDQQEKDKTPQRLIPDGRLSLPKVYIETPGHKGVTSKTVWVELATIKILGDGDAVLYEADSLKIRGRGNSSWNYSKKPYYIKLNHKAGFYGTGKSRRWVLLANWMDRTLLRNQVAFEAARRTSLEWTPYGQFVELYLNGTHLGNYWLGEKINVEGSKFEADYLYSFDTSDATETDFTSTGTYRANVKRWSTPVEVKYPDRDDYETGFDKVISDAKSVLDGMTNAISGGTWENVIDLDSFCDWYLVHELCYNMEPNHPKSCFFHWREGKMYAGPVWDFDWCTFTPGHSSLDAKNCLWYSRLFTSKTFTSRLKERWATLKPEFESLGDYIDEQADIIRASEEVNHRMWPCYPHPYSEDGSRMVNHDEQLTFQQAVDRMKDALTDRISAMDTKIAAL